MSWSNARRCSMRCAPASSTRCDSVQPLDVLAQQLVAEVSAREYGEDELYDLVRRAWPYRALERRDFDELLRMLAEGISHPSRPAKRLSASRCVNRRVRARRGARLTAITCGGAIPDNADYQVVLEPAGTFIGTLNEDFAVESLAGDVFQLGNCSYRILRVEAGRVRVEDAKGQPPTMPFWLGEAPARSAELSLAVSRLRAQIDAACPIIDARTHRRLHRPGVRRMSLGHGGAPAGGISGRAKAVLGNCRRSSGWCSSASSTRPVTCIW
jgi:Lhr-like helicase